MICPKDFKGISVRVYEVKSIGEKDVVVGRLMMLTECCIEKNRNVTVAVSPF
jgi:hypothetical protein